MPFLVVFGVLLVIAGLIVLPGDVKKIRYHLALKRGVEAGRYRDWVKRGNQYVAAVPESTGWVVGPWLILIALALFLATALTR